MQYHGMFQLISYKYYEFALLFKLIYWISKIRFMAMDGITFDFKQQQDVDKQLQ